MFISLVYVLHVHVIEDSRTWKLLQYISSLLKEYSFAVHHFNAFQKSLAGSYCCIVQQFNYKFDGNNKNVYKCY